MIQLSKILRQVPLFHTLGKESIDFIIQRLKFKTFNANDTVCQIGDPGDEMYIIISGKVKICIYSEDGKEQVVATLSSGDYFGEMSLLTGEPRSATVITTEDSEMFALHKNDFDVILEKFPSISISIGKIVSQRLRETLEKASHLPQVSKIEATQQGPQGSLKHVPLVDLIRFCESNSVTGTLRVKNNSQEGTLEFKAGQLQEVKLSDMSEDEALDTMLNWQDGFFAIELRPLKLDRFKEDETKEVEIRNVLILSNSLVVQKIIERALTSMGYSISKAKNITDGAEVFRQRNIDLIVSDIKLPDGDGLKLIETVREIKETPIVFLGESNLKPEYRAMFDAHKDIKITQGHEVSEIVQLIEHFNQNE
ncbi:MAG: cyclic nucleotide-binding domain-containing protein [Calditrichaeota bacterium]|nr:cyclic nucleotide-binding domain-containing protein [Calditrichota bacterium]